MSEDAKFDSWCIVEVMGHSRFAGRVTEQEIGGASFIRVDVPETELRMGTSAVEERPAFTKLLSPGSIFAITPCTEITAREAAKSFRARPFAMFELPMLPSRSDMDDEEY